MCPTRSVGQTKAHGHFGNRRHRSPAAGCGHEAPLLHGPQCSVVQAGNAAALRDGDTDRCAIRRYVDLEQDPALLATSACHLRINRRSVRFHASNRMSGQHRSNYSGRLRGGWPPRRLRCLRWHPKDKPSARLWWLGWLWWRLQCRLRHDCGPLSRRRFGWLLRYGRRLRQRGRGELLRGGLRCRRKGFCGVRLCRRGQSRFGGSRLRRRGCGGRLGSSDLHKLQSHRQFCQWTWRRGPLQHNKGRKQHGAVR
jgi:hypothetical protein